MPKAQPPDLRGDDHEGRTLARHYPRGMYIEPHAHDWAQVLYAVAGVMWVEVGHEALVVPPQRAVWLPAGTVHSIRMMSAVDMRNLYLPPRQVTHLSEQGDVFEVNGLLRELITTLAEHPDKGEQVQHAQVRQRMHDRGESDEEPDAAYRQAAYRLTILALSRAPRYSLRVPLPRANGTDRRLETLCRAVIANPSIAISFEQHATSVGASVRTLSRLFTQELGIGFAEWRRQVQLAAAVSGLTDGQSVSSVARALGYLPSSFSDMFRRELGTSPSDFHSNGTLQAP